MAFKKRIGQTVFVNKVTNMKLIRKELDKLIKEKYNFFIPDYQRGYKWTRTEVLKLLNDIWDFKLNHNTEDDSDFYCLQPVVVKPKDNRYYVIDGQQRLTTLLIIQQAIKDYDALKKYQRFIDEDLNKFSNLTTGKVFSNVISIFVFVSFILYFLYSVIFLLKSSLYKSFISYSFSSIPILFI